MRCHSWIQRDCDGADRHADGRQRRAGGEGGGGEQHQLAGVVEAAGRGADAEGGGRGLGQRQRACCVCDGAQQ